MKILIVCVVLLLAVPVWGELIAVECKGKEQLTLKGKKQQQVTVELVVPPPARWPVKQRELIKAVKLLWNQNERAKADIRKKEMKGKKSLKRYVVQPLPDWVK
jgi:hypothetical protein